MKPSTSCCLCFWLTGGCTFLLFSCKTTDNLSFLFDWWKFRILLTVEQPVRTLGLWGLTVITFIYKASFRSQLERAQNTGWTVRSSGTFAEGSCFCEVNWYCLERTNGITFTTNTVCRPHAEKNITTQMMKWLTTIHWLHTVFQFSFTS